VIMAVIGENLMTSF